jgi:nitrite reductase/ring-hydroxylating ferredoxin subunit
VTLNPAQPAPGTLLCRLDDLADPGARGFYFRADDMLFHGFIVRRAGEVFGYIDRCPHAGTPLAAVGDRYLTREGDLILCGTHGALFRPESGLCIGGPCAGQSLTPWPIRMEAGQILTA